MRITLYRLKHVRVNNNLYQCLSTDGPRTASGYVLPQMEEVGGTLI